MIHYDNLGTARFITFSCFRRQKLLITEDVVSIVLEELENNRIKYRFSILGYVIMPNHVHLVLYTGENTKMGTVIGDIKRVSAYKIISRWEEFNNKMLDLITVPHGRRQRYAFWLPRCYDHNCRTPEFVREKIIYCHNNPVRAGLIEEPGKWRWSSYGSYLGDRSSPVIVTQVEL
jgi:putative transposase